MKFLIGKKEDFAAFLNSIVKKDKVAVISHTDSDGVVSAALIKDILSSRKIKIRSFYFINYKKGMLKEIHGELIQKKISKIFILDINVHTDYEEFEKFREDFDVFLVDHHPSDIKEEANIIKTETEDCVAFVLYEIGKEVANLDKWKFLVCATMISEFSYNSQENFDFIKSSYPDADRNDMLNSVPGNLSQKLTSALIYFRGREKKILDLLLKNKLKKFYRYHWVVAEEIKRCVEKFRKEAEFYSEKNIYLYYFSPRFSIASIVATILSMEEKDKTFIFVSDVEEEKGFVKVSARNQSGNANLNELMKRGIDGLESASGGGHIKASAAIFLKKDLGQFKKNILEQ
jgi:single-stranded DNA-specific DHH superfamily exonuclease